MDDLDRAVNRALAAAHGHPTVRPYVEHAVALARFEAHAEFGGPLRHEPLSEGCRSRPSGRCIPRSSM